MPQRPTFSDTEPHRNVSRETFVLTRLFTESTVSCETVDFCDCFVMLREAWHTISAHLHVRYTKERNAS